MTMSETEAKQSEVCLHVVRVYSVRRRTNVRTQYEVFLAWLTLNNSSLSSCRPRVDSRFRVINFYFDFINVPLGFWSIQSDSVNSISERETTVLETLFLASKFVTSIRLDTNRQLSWDVETCNVECMQFPEIDRYLRLAISQLYILQDSREFWYFPRLRYLHPNQSDTSRGSFNESRHCPLISHYAGCGSELRNNMRRSGGYIDSTGTPPSTSTLPEHLFQLFQLWYQNSQPSSGIRVSREISRWWHLIFVFIGRRVSTLVVNWWQSEFIPDHCSLSDIFRKKVANIANTRPCFDRTCVHLFTNSNSNERTIRAAV